MSEPASQDRSELDTSLLATADKAGRFIENLCLSLLLFGMVGLASSQIFLRNITGSGFSWADEALRLMVLWVAMLGAVAAARDDRQIAIDVLSRFMPEQAKRITLAAMNLFTATLSFILAWYCFEFVAESREYEDVVLGDLPAWVFQSVMPLAFGLIGYRYVIWAIKRIVEFFKDLKSGQVDSGGAH